MTDGDVQHIEMQVLAGFFDTQRASVLAFVDGLDQEALQAVVFSSGWTPLGLIGHLGHAERHWFSASPLISCSAGTARGRLVRHSAPHRYVWPSELDLMAKLGGFPVRDRWASWNPGAVHLRQPKPGCRLRETATAAYAQIYQVGASLSRRHRAKSRARSARRALSLTSRVTQRDAEVVAWTF
jgi:hypothetical protein